MNELRYIFYSISRQSTDEEFTMKSVQHPTSAYSPKYIFFSYMFWQKWRPEFISFNCVLLPLVQLLIFRSSTPRHGNVVLFAPTPSVFITQMHMMAQAINAIQLIELYDSTGLVSPNMLEEAWESIDTPAITFRTTLHTWDHTRTKDFIRMQ